MKIAYTSGKGGTGKTTIATNLAISIAKAREVTYCDCDVEEPNGLIFLKPMLTSKELIGRPVPLVDETKCTECGFINHERRIAKAYSRLDMIIHAFPEYRYIFASLWGKIKEEYGK